MTNIFRDILSIKFINNLIVVRATMKVSIIPIKYTSIKINSSLMYNLASSNTVAEIITGIDKNKENLEELNRLYPRNLPAVITTPERLTPGITDNAWKTPIKKASVKLISFFVIFLKSDKPNKTPNKRVVHPIKIITLLKSNFIKVMNTPKTMTGIVPIIINFMNITLKDLFLLWKRFFI